MPAEAGSMAKFRGAKPFGNSLFDSKNPRIHSLGHFAIFDDQLLLTILSKLGPCVVSQLSKSSIYTYAFCYHDDLWRDFVIAMNLPFKFNNNWRNTFKSLHQRKFVLDVPINFTGLYSDLLYMYGRCSTATLKDICGYQIDNISKCRNITKTEFTELFLSQNKPCLIQGGMDLWKARSWTMESFKGAETKFVAENVELSFDDYLQYISECHEESPLYLFDKSSLLRPEFAADFDVPTFFNEDLFTLLGPIRPDYRWLIVGPERSGSTFHIDPNATNAWNACILGQKKWILFPPENIPPGVFPNSNLSEVMSPSSLVEWFLNFYPSIRGLPKSQRPVECICRAGEIIFVPNGWWHCVLNLEPGIAITQNFVCKENLSNVLAFCKDKPDQVSGFHGNLYTAFCDAIRQERPDLIDIIDGGKGANLIGCSNVNKNKKRKWSKLVEEAEFNFDFK